MFAKLIISDFKRIRQLMIPFAILFAALLSIMITLVRNADKLVYQNKSETVNIGILMQADSEYSNSAYNMISNMDSYKSICNFIDIESRDEGMELLDNGSVNALIIVPDNILSSIMDGTNTPVEVIYPEDGSLQTFILNELFVSTSSLLGTSQAAIYSVLSLCRELDISGDDFQQASTAINNLFLNHVLSRTDLFKSETLNVTGSYTVIEHYTAALIFLLLSLCSIMFMSFFRSHNQAVVNLLKANGINKFQTALSQFLSVWSVLYLFYIVIYILLGTVSKLHGFFSVSINIKGLVLGILLSSMIAITAAIVSRLPVSLAGCSLLLFLLILMTAYTGGLIVPELLLPKIFKNICPYTPGNTILRFICECIYQ